MGLVRAGDHRSSFALAAFAQLCQAGKLVKRPCTYTP